MPRGARSAAPLSARRPPCPLPPSPPAALAAAAMDSAAVAVAMVRGGVQTEVKVTSPALRLLWWRSPPMRLPSLRCHPGCSQWPAARDWRALGQFEPTFPQVEPRRIRLAAPHRSLTALSPPVWPQAPRPFWASAPHGEPPLREPRPPPRVENQDRLHVPPQRLHAARQPRTSQVHGPSHPPPIAARARRVCGSSPHGWLGWRVRRTLQPHRWPPDARRHTYTREGRL